VYVSATNGRLAELGVRVHAGAVRFDPGLLRAREFVESPHPFRFLDVDGCWQQLMVPAKGLAFTWCQVPIVYRLDESAEAGVTVTRDDGECQVLPEMALPADIARQVFRRSGRIRRIELVLNSRQLLSGQP
jgi:hypothetical protein